MSAGNAKKGRSTTLHNRIAEMMVELNKQLEEDSARALATERQKYQVDIICQVYRKHDKLVAAYDKIRPKAERFDEDHKPIGPLSFSKEDVEKRKKLKERIQKCENAINKIGDGNGDVSDAINIANSKDTEED